MSRETVTKKAIERQIVAPQVVEFSVSWREYPNDDIEDDAGGVLPPDVGWYVEMEPNGEGIGPDFYGPGCQSFDEALAVIDKWCKGRGYERNPEQVFTVRVVRTGRLRD